MWHRCCPGHRNVTLRCLRPAAGRTTDTTRPAPPVPTPHEPHEPHPCDIRQPLTPTGTNLLGLVKHLGGVGIGYFGDTFGRPFGEPLPAGFEEDAEPNAEF
jgi:hypothetical protein